jgi:adenylate cyclase, class 2
MQSHRRTAKPEIEIKLRVKDVPRLVRDLKRIGARPRGRVFEQNTLYDTPESSMRRSGCLLRVRVESPAAAHSLRAGPGGAVLTFKAPTAKTTGHRRYKERLECELAVEHPGAWPQRLRSLGLRPTFRYEKYRSMFVLRHLQLDLDETPAGVFLELEGAPRAIDRAARRLGYAPREYILGTYWDVYVADCRRRGRIPRNFMF